MNRLKVNHIKRLEELAGAGLSDRAIATVLNLDFDADVTHRQVNYYRRKYTEVVRPRRNPEVPRGRMA